MRHNLASKYDRAIKFLRDLGISGAREESTECSSIQTQIAIAVPKANGVCNVPTSDINNWLPNAPISKRSRVFDTQITSLSLSEILLWYLYFDLVENSRSAHEMMWELVDSDTMVNWIRLGKELQSTRLTQFPGLQKACNELPIPMHAASRRLIRLSDKITMLRTERAQKGMIGTDKRLLGILTTKLWHDRALALKLRPLSTSHWMAKQAAIIAIIDSYIAIVVRPATLGPFSLEPPHTTSEADFRHSIRQAWAALSQTRSPPLNGVYELAENVADRWQSFSSYSHAARSQADWPTRTSSLPPVGPWPDPPRTFPGLYGSDVEARGDESLTLHSRSAFPGYGDDNDVINDSGNDDEEERVELAIIRILRGKTLRGSLVDT